MPYKKRNNYKADVKRAIKRRLLEISIRVDGYIYKNKPIDVEEAKKCIHEISVHRTECNNDIHILQVIEKLTRCMKTIIEDTEKKVLYNQAVDASENQHCVHLFSESSSNKKLEINNKHNCTNVEVGYTSKDQKTSTAISKITSNNQNAKKVNKNNEKPLICNEVNITESSIGACFSNVHEKANKKETCKVVSHQSLLNIKDVKGTSNLATQDALINRDISESSINNVKDTKDVNVDQVRYSDIRHKPQETTRMNRNSNLILENSLKTRKCKKNTKNGLEHPQQRYTPETHYINVKNNKKKKSEINQSYLSSSFEALHLEATMKKNKSKNLKTAIDKNINAVTKQNGKQKTNNKSANAMNKRKKSSNKINKNVTNDVKNHCIKSPLVITPQFRATPNVYRQTHVEMIKKKMSLPEQRISNNIIENQLTHQDIAEQMGALKIYNERVVNDFSWIEGIRYTREISTEEFDQMSNRYNEVFWEDFSLPNGWSDVDFHD